MTDSRWALALVMSFVLVTGSVSVQPAVGAPLLGGTVLSIDVKTLIISLRMPRGESWLLPVANQTLLRDIRVGDHVTLELDVTGRITKLEKLPTDPAN